MVNQLISIFNHFLILAVTNSVQNILLMLKIIKYDFLFIFGLALTPLILVPCLYFIIIKCFKTGFKNKTVIVSAFVFSIAVLAILNLTKTKISLLEKKLSKWIPGKTLYSYTNPLKKTVSLIKTLSIITGGLYLIFYLIKFYKVQYQRAE